MNKLLNKKEFPNYQYTLDIMKKYTPEMCSRKIPDALIQQAFTLQTALYYLEPKKDIILSAGSWEDTATETLKKLGYNVIDVDPMINSDLKTYYDNHSELEGTIGGVISTSVLEHVENDGEFVEIICKLLKPKGYGIMTMDFNNNYPNTSKPNEDHRLYTEYDLLIRLKHVLNMNGCELIEPIDYSGENDFVYCGHWYTFATFVFMKA